MVEYYTFNMVPTSTEGSDYATTLLVAGSVNLFCTLHYDSDSISSTYGHWICVIDFVSDDIDIPERSIVLYPDTLHFDGDEYYSIVIKSESETIGLNDLDKVKITVGVPLNE